jgi:hypothetical protein
MKKLNLNLSVVKEQLSKDQMKKINGGWGDYCGDTCYGGSGDCSNASSEDTTCDYCGMGSGESGWCV